MILDLHRQGLTIAEIARQTGQDRKTVRKYIARGLAAPSYGPRQPRARRLDPFTAYRYVREDFFLARSFRNLDDLNAQYGAWLAEVANARRHATTGRIVEAHFAEEAASLLPLPAGPYSAVLKLERRVTREGMVSLGGNQYSVPDTTRRRAVEVHSLAEEIRIFEDGQLIARHPVLEGRGRRRIAAGHRTLPPPANSQTRRAGTETPISRAGEQVARRDLAVYEAIGRKLARAEARP